MFSPEDEPGGISYAQSAKDLPYSPDIHMKTAVRVYERQLLIDRIRDSNSPAPPYVRFSVEELKRFFYDQPKSFSISTEDFYGRILSPKLTHKGLAQSEKSQLFDNVEIAKHLSVISDQILFKHFPEDESKRKLKSSVARFTVPESLRSWYTYRNLWEEIRDDMRFQQISKNYKFKEISNGLLDFEVVTNAFYSLLTTNQKDYWILD